MARVRFTGVRPRCVAWSYPKRAKSLFPRLEPPGGGCWERGHVDIGVRLGRQIASSGHVKIVARIVQLVTIKMLDESEVII